MWQQLVEELNKDILYKRVNKLLLLLLSEFVSFKRIQYSTIIFNTVG